MYATAEPVEQLDVRLLHPDARAPERSREGDAGYDLRCLEGFVLEPGARLLVSTGVAIALPDGVAGLVLPRSGLAIRHGVTTLNAPGLVDPTYRGEVKVILHNAGAGPYEARAGDRIAQLLLVAYRSPSTRVVDELAPSADGRADSGFGSSGR
ncbi:MAG: dUTP pyrophosphatase [Solirubrobacteraceae bacterium]|jgi:dUTP pyrophosphatase|nr:dUTP pyrophosphatase [Solirubrobacteraceae bacterium]